jgi:triacylglycerol lipase
LFAGAVLVPARAERLGWATVKLGGGDLRCSAWGGTVRRRLFLVATAASCASLLSACAGISTAELDKIGGQVVHANIDFKDLYAYAERSNAAYQDKRAIKLKYPLTVRINSPDGTQARYFLESDDINRTQFISVRGTHTNKNLAEDLDIAVRDDRKVDIPVHAGFDSDARAIYSDVKPHLKLGFKTYLTGHSLGAAVAAILAIYLIEDGFQVERVVTFGQPRFTTTDGVKRLGFLPLTRIVDENDIVPMVAPSTYTDPKYGPYDQVGPEVILLEGPDFVYLPSHDASRIDLGEFWRSLTFANLRDHEMPNYLRRIESKFTTAREVPYTQRERYVVSSAEQVIH